MLRILIRGVGDVGSAVAHRLFLAGHEVMLHDDPQPTAARRGMAFTDAVFDGRSELDGVAAVRVDSLDSLPDLLAAHDVIAVSVADLAAVLAAAPPDVLVDARMRKRARPEPQRGLAKLAIGLGPSFVPGETTDVVVETSWGPALGRVLTTTPALPLRGEPRPIAGHARDRFVYAPHAGVFRTTLGIGDRVGVGQVVARIGSTDLTAPLAGALRGLTRDGAPVTAGTKVIEVDPRGPAGVVRGIGERPARIADGVLAAIRTWAERCGLD
jgi:xanthine dehydrogenase accessory factor